MPNEYNGSGEVQIDWKDLLLRIFLQWRKIIVFVFIGALLLGVIGGISAYRERQWMVAEGSSDSSEERLERLRAALSEQEIAEVQSAYDLYKGYDQQYELLLAYKNESLKMNLDPGHVFKGEIWFRVDNYYQVQYPTINSSNNISAIVFSYILQLERIDMYEKLVSSLSIDTTPEYLQELVQVKSINEKQGQAEETGIFSVCVTAESEDFCNNILDAAEQEVEQVTGNFREIYGDFQVVALERQVEDGVDLALLEEQQTQIEQMQEISSAMQELASDLTEAQEAYYLALIQDSGEKKPIDEETVQASVNWLNVNYIVFGALVGAFVACVMVALQYLFNTRLRVIEDAAVCCRTPILGVFPPEIIEKKRMFSFVDRWICALFGKTRTSVSKETMQKIIETKLTTALESLNLQSVFLVSSQADSACGKIRKDLKKIIGQDGVSVTEGDKVLENPDSLQAMLNATGIVFVERLNVSRYSDLREIASLCEQYHKD